MRPMSKTETQFPDVGELIVGKVTRIDRFGAYLILEDYPGIEAFLHISEISLKWVRNIRDYIREGQRYVFKVIRVNPATYQVDVSLRRVSQKEKTEKMLEWKRRQKVNRILSILRERTKTPEKELNKLIREPYENDDEKIYEAFEKISEGDPVSQFFSGLSKKVEQELEILVKQEIKHKVAEIHGELVMSTTHRYGADAIRKAAAAAEALAGQKEEVTITVKGPPRYFLRIRTADRERAEELLNEILETTRQVLQEYGGVAEFKRTA